MSEAAEVLADALEFRLRFREDSLELKLSQLQHYPNLLYQMSDPMRKIVFNDLTVLLEAYWKGVLLYLVHLTVL